MSEIMPYSEYKTYDRFSITIFNNFRRQVHNSMRLNSEDPGLSLYNIIMKKQFGDFLNHYMGDMTFEAFCCEVDVAYRREYNIFPSLDDKMPTRLPKCTLTVGKTMIADLETEMMRGFDTDVGQAMDFQTFSTNMMLYHDIMNGCYEDFSIHYAGECTFNEFCCDVDVAYRREHGSFPIADSEMPEKLVKLAIFQGKKQIDELDEDFHSHQYQQHVEETAERLWDQIDMFLRSPIHKIIQKNHGYLSSRRFPRGLISKLDLFEHDDRHALGDVINDAMKWLRKKKYIRLVEKGSKSKYDVFELIDV